MDTIKDCVTCKHHHGKTTIDDVPSECYPCVWAEQSLGYYPGWQPIEEQDERGWQGYEKIIFKTDGKERMIVWPGDIEAPVGTMKQDNVNSPKHYTSGGIETIDYIRAKLGDEGTVAYCMGNVMKYTSRWQDKNGLEDLKKADWYLSYAIDVLESK